MENNTAKNILNIISGDARAWAVGKVLEVLVSIVSSLSIIEKKIDSLLMSKLHSGQRALDLAKKYPDGSIYQKEAISDAKKYFHEASSQVLDIYKPISLYLAGICCGLLKDNVGKRKYYQDSIEALDQYIEYCKDALPGLKAKKGLGGAAAFGAMITTVAFAPFGAAAIPFVFIAQAAGITGFALTIDAATREAPNENTPIPFGFTIGELRTALTKGVKS